MQILSEKSREILLEKFKEKQKKHPSFSLRAFARHLKISPTALSEGLNGKRSIPLEVLKSISQKLELSTLETANVFASHDIQFEYLDESEFEKISDWEFFAILNMTRLEDFQSNPTWIAQRLGISTERAEYVFETLKNLKLVHEEDGRWKRINKIIHCKKGISTELAKKCLHQDFQLIDRAFDIESANKRDSSAITFILTEDKFKEAQVLIRKMRVDLVALSDTNSTANFNGEVYKLSCHLVPLTKRWS